MKKSLILIIVTLLTIFSLESYGDSSMPHLKMTSKGLQMIVDGKPYIMLAGELHNSSTGSVHYMAPIWKRMHDEIGTLDFDTFAKGTENRSMRDYSTIANSAFKGQVPKQLIDYLSNHRNQLHPVIDSVWKANGQKKNGTWEEVFGKSTPLKPFDHDAENIMNDNKWQGEYPYLTEEIFNSWYYANYIETIAKKGKEQYPLPMYVNSWIKQRFGREPGAYPSGGPQPHLFDIWRAAAPDVDLYAPDIYAIDTYDWVCKEFNNKRNPLFIPETTDTPDGAARAFYTFGKYNTICYSPFGIDGRNVDNGNSIKITYGMLQHLLPYITKYSGTDG